MKNFDPDIQEPVAQLAVLEPTPADAPRPASLALAQVKQRLTMEERMSRQSRFHQFFTTPGRRYATAVVLAAVMLAVAFTFPNVRAAASEFLSLFRVQNFAAITISPEQIAVLSQIAEEGLSPGEIEIFEDPGQLTAVDSIDAAATLTGLKQVRTIEQLGPPQAVYVSAAGNGRLTVDLEGSRAILEAVGVDPTLLPDDLDGAEVDVFVFSGVDQQWEDDLHLLQSETPLVDYPDGLDTVVLGQALLQVLGLSEEEAVRLSQEIDWTSTLLLPIPQNIAAYHEVTVDGVSGMVISELNGRSASIIWQKDGVLYTLIGNRSAEELVQLANTLSGG
jgi:hypothetical protein